MRLIVLASFLGLCGGLVEATRINCHPESDIIDEEVCTKRGCTYEPSPGSQAPDCFFPQNRGYSWDKNVEDTDRGQKVTLTKIEDQPEFASEPREKLVLETTYFTEEILRVSIRAEGEERWEVPLEMPSLDDLPLPNSFEPLYEVKFDSTPEGTFFFDVVRKDGEASLFKTDLPALIFEDQFLQIAAKLPSENVYGFGENEQLAYKHDFLYTEFYGYAWDMAPRPFSNLYGVHPTYTVVEDDGKTHTVLFLNSNAQEWNFVPEKTLIFRSIGGILDFFFFLGPSPDETNQQYASLVGKQPLPPYWSLGFHICRWGYENLDEVKEVVKRTRDYGIPHDVQFIDIDIWERNVIYKIDYDNFGGVKEFVDELHASGQKFITIVNPFIAAEEKNYPTFMEGESWGDDEVKIWVKDAKNESLVGDCWPIKEDGKPSKVVYADYFLPEAQAWWAKQLVELRKEIEYDALWIDMNEPVNFNELGIMQCDEDSKLNFPPYKIKVNLGDPLSTKTLCPDAWQKVEGNSINHYNPHSLYGWSMSKPSIAGVKEATKSRGWVLSRSTFVGSGKWVAHWLGDNYANWSNLRASIIGMLQFNRFAMPHVGADICGFFGSPTEELCARWQQLGAFYPFSRNHNNLGEDAQDPAVFGPDLARITREALNIRYRFLPYLYNLFYQHSIKGSSVIRALWDEFPADKLAWDIDQQFLWGSSLLISPVVDQGQDVKRAYFPDARWFDISHWLTRNIIREQKEVGQFVDLEAPRDTIPVHVRGDSIFVLQREDVNTERSRVNDWIILVALGQKKEESDINYEFFMDDGNSDPSDEHYNSFTANLSYKKNGEGVGEITIPQGTGDYTGLNSQLINEIEVVGIGEKVSKVTKETNSGDEVELDFFYNDGRLSIRNANVKWNEFANATINIEFGSSSPFPSCDKHDEN